MNKIADMVKRGLARSRRLAGKPACDHAGARVVADRPLFRAFFCDRCGEAFNEFKPFNFPTDPPLAP